MQRIFNPTIGLPLLLIIGFCFIFVGVHVGDKVAAPRAATTSRSSSESGAAPNTEFTTQAAPQPLITPQSQSAAASSVNTVQSPPAAAAANTTNPQATSDTTTSMPDDNTPVTIETRKTDTIPVKTHPTMSGATSDIIRSFNFNLPL